MKVRTVAYGKTFNLGNYESERIELTAELDEGENAVAVHDSLNKLVHELYQDGLRKGKDKAW